MPTVQPRRAACATIWPVVYFSPGRRMRSIACISSTVAKSFIPIGVTRMRSSAFSSSTSAGQSYSFGSSTAISSMLMTLFAYPSCFRLVHAEARG